MDLLAAIESQRIEIAAMLKKLTTEQWATRSCCDDWTVQEVAAHLTQGWNYSLAHGMVQMLKARGDLRKVNRHCVAPLAAAGPTAIIADLCKNAASNFKPPGMGLEAPLNDLVIHRRDMFLPLGIAYDTPPELIQNSLAMATKGGMAKMVNSVKVLNGLRCVATDLDWSWGDGQKITGPSLPLAHALWGRRQSLGELSGPGVEVLRQRLAAR
jgi:uncharacterized protein (TIGR03083 family)